MAKYEVTTDMIIHCKVRVIVEANDKDGAIDAAAEALPSNWDRDASKAWRASVDLKSPKSVTITSCRPYHFEQASGQDKARKLPETEDAN